MDNNEKIKCLYLSNDETVIPQGWTDHSNARKLLLFMDSVTSPYNTRVEAHSRDWFSSVPRIIWKRMKRQNASTCVIMKQSFLRDKEVIQSQENYTCLRVACCEKYVRCLYSITWIKLIAIDRRWSNFETSWSMFAGWNSACQFLMENKDTNFPLFRLNVTCLSLSRIQRILDGHSWTMCTKRYTVTYPVEL